MDPVKAAKNQSLFREVNERVRAVSQSFADDAGTIDFMCECAMTDCEERVHLSLADYQEIRRVPTHFFVTASMEHVFPDAERIFAEREGYYVVEKFGEAGVAATKVARGLADPVEL
jgi:hypothetical protein